MRVVLDTNVLISALAVSAGVTSQLFLKVVTSHELILSEHILGKFLRNMPVKMKVPVKLVEEAVLYLRRRAKTVDIGKAKPVEFSDPDDVPILQLLESAEAHYLITGDKKLLALKKHKTTLILSVREALEIF
jgi:putative PIN family toxin of toxin-antitoxin system